MGKVTKTLNFHETKIIKHELMPFIQNQERLKIFINAEVVE